SLHGLVFSDRTPTPGLVELAKAYAPLRIEVDDAAVTIRNDRHTTSTADLVFTWYQDSLGSGVLELPPIAPGESLTVKVPCEIESGVLTVRAALAADTAWA